MPNNNLRAPFDSDLKCLQYSPRAAAELITQPLSTRCQALRSIDFKPACSAAARMRRSKVTT
jgi:hypothetical protein